MITQVMLYLDPSITMKQAECLADAIDDAAECYAACAKQLEGEDQRHILIDWDADVAIDALCDAIKEVFKR